MQSPLNKIVLILKRACGVVFEVLKERGFNVVIDGRMGSRTMEAITAFQRQQASSERPYRQSDDLSARIVEQDRRARRRHHWPGRRCNWSRRCGPAADSCATEP